MTNQSLEERAKELGISTESVATEILDIDRFTLAEHYHQKYAIRRHDPVRDFLQKTYPTIKPFADSTVATRINGLFGSGTGRSWKAAQGEISKFGLPPELKAQFQERSRAALT